MTIDELNLVPTLPGNDVEDQGLRNCEVTETCYWVASYLTWF